MKRLLALAVVLIGALSARAEGPDTRPIVWILDGAGDFHGCSSGVAQANIQAGNPFELAHFPWSHGYRRLYLDQVDQKYARQQGIRLAEKIIERSKLEPGRRQVVIAHSAGAAVALAAGDYLPANSIDHLVLLAPSVSSYYDVRPVLQASREGMDVFCSKKDWVALGVATRLVGTVDKRWAPAAGRHGFRNADPNSIRQYFWSNELTWTGYDGRHAGVHAPAFLQAYVFPLLIGR